MSLIGTRLLTCGQRRHVVATLCEKGLISARSQGLESLQMTRCRHRRWLTVQQS